MRTLNRFWLATLLVITLACGGSSSEGPKLICEPGGTRACLGAGACGGAQSCKDDGSGWTACDCGGKSETGVDSDLPDDSVDSGSSGDTSAPDDTTATDTSSDTSVAPLTPDKLTGLGLWLDSDKGVFLTPDGINNIKWLDQSSFSNTTKMYCGGGCSGGCPLTCGLRKLVADTKGGHDAYQLLSSGTIDCCTFNGTIFTVADDPSLQFGKGQFAIFIVAKALGVAAPIDLWGKYPGGTTSGLSIVLDSTKLEVKTDTASGKLTYTSSSGYHLVIVRGPALRLQLDGATATGTTATDDLSAVGTTLAIGNVLGAGARGELAIAEYVAVKGTISDSQVLAVAAYLKTKHKIAF